MCERKRWSSISSHAFLSRTCACCGAAPAGARSAADPESDIGRDPGRDPDPEPEPRREEDEEASVSRLALVDARSVARRRLELEAEEAIVGTVCVVCIVSVVSLLAMESLRIRAVGKRPRMLEARSLLEESGSGLRVRPAGKRRSSSMICVLISETLL